MEDNQGAIKLGYNAEFYKRTKHIDIKYYYIRELVENNQIGLLYISTKNQLADPQTKLITSPILSIGKKTSGYKNISPGGFK